MKGNGSDKRCLVPNWQEISKAAVDVIYERFDAYGNAWVRSDPKYFGIRMQNEVEEYKNAMSDAEKRRKCLNIINLAMMAFTVCDGKQAECKHYVLNKERLESITQVITAKCNVCEKILFVANGTIFDNVLDANEYFEEQAKLDGRKDDRAG